MSHKSATRYRWCPKCGSAHARVTDSRPRAIGDEPATVRRRRLCERCGYRWTTFEVSAAVLNAAQANKKLIVQLQNVIERMEANVCL